MLLKLLMTLRNTFVGLLVFAMTVFFPTVSFAATSDAATCTPPSATQPGVRVPTGSDADMYHYDCKQSLWVSDHYTFDPATGITTPRDAQVYTYNDSTGLWDASIWTYSAAKQAYVLLTVSVIQPPAGATTVGGPKPVTPQVTAPTPATPTTTNTSPVTGTSTSAGGTVTNNTSAALNNAIGSLANSGNALVFANTTGGSALSGNAQALATVVNMLQSSNNAFGASGNAVTFVSNINGDVNGDLLLDPALISTIQPATDTLTLNNANNTDQAINNTLNLAAQSGNATVGSNTNAGSATTGSATAIANVLNFLNSAVTSGKSFLGVVNINGNLNGDILLPPGFIDQLLASNVPTVTINTDVNLANNTNQAINNAVTATAASGTATVDKNTTAGSATTGSASTHITAFNLTGSNIVGSNDLLVFVNVLGTWYGMIFNAPGASSAELGGGITGNSTVNSDLNLANNTNQAINNAINVSARSGNAAVTGNTNAGNALSGDARAAVNLLNVTNSNLSLANWFGILFINVFGTWNGSFGINTAAGNPVVTPPTSGGSGGSDTPANTPGTPQMFAFVARTVGSQSTAGPSSNDSTGTSSSFSPTSPDQKGVVLAAQTQHKTSHPAASLPTTEGTHANFWLPGAGIALGVGMLLFERIRSFRHTR